MREITKTSQKFFMLPTLEKDNRYDSWKITIRFGDVYGYQVQMNEIIKIKTIVKWLKIPRVIRWLGDLGVLGISRKSVNHLTKVFV